MKKYLLVALAALNFSCAPESKKSLNQDVGPYAYLNQDECTPEIRHEIAEISFYKILKQFEITESKLKNETNSEENSNFSFSFRTQEGDLYTGEMLVLSNPCHKHSSVYQLETNNQN